jgi:hypothetical protein
MFMPEDPKDLKEAVKVRDDLLNQAKDVMFANKKKGRAFRARKDAVNNAVDRLCTHCVLQARITGDKAWAEFGDKTIKLFETAMEDKQAVQSLTSYLY